MTRLNWGAAGTRTYETGIDRCVLYLDGQDGVAWSGLTSVSENPTGGEAQPFYIDGVKYLNIPSAEEFEATITAFTYPDAFGVCDGTARVRSGLFVRQQDRQPFNLSYRTQAGSDLSTSLGYKIHLIYNALATPSQRVSKTIGDSADLTEFSWNITTKPPAAVGYKRTSHLIIDSRYTNPVTMADVEDILYGSDLSGPRILSLTELIDVFDTDATLTITDNGDGTWTASGPDDVIQMLSPTTFQITSDSAVFLTADTYTISSL